MRLRTLIQAAAAAVLLPAVAAPAALATPGVTVSAAPNPAIAGETVTYTVSAPFAEVGDTVTLQDMGYEIAGCIAVPVVADAATCTAPASSTPGWHLIYPVVTQTDTSSYGGSSSYLRVLTKTTTTVTAAPKLASPGETMQYVATISPRAELGIASIDDDPVAQACGGGCGPDPETVDFSVDGVAIDACADRPVDIDTGVATCSKAAPIAGGQHVVTADYSGDNDQLGASHGQGDFAVKQPGITLSAASSDFGSVLLGATSARAVTVTNSGTGDLHVGATTVSGPFAAAAGCANATLAPAASCVIDLAFTPTAAGVSAGSLAVSSDAGSPSVSLTGTGNAVVNVTDPPTGARLAPNTATTFTAGGRGANTVTVPIRCPSDVACTLDGTVVIATSDLAKAAHSSATSVRTVARFSGIRVAPGKVRAIKLKLSPAFIRSAQRRGIRLIRATLTIHTTFTDGTKATSKQRVKIRIPRAAAKKRALAPHFTG